MRDRARSSARRLLPLLFAIGISLLLTFWLEREVYRPAADGVDVNDRPIGQDFINIWSGPYFAFHDRIDLLFDPDAYTQAAGERFGHQIQPYTWSYPPHTLLLYWPFSLPPYFAAYALWSVLGLSVWLLTYRLYAGRLDARALLTLCASPAAAMNIIDGQNGFIAAALFVGGLLALRRHPILAGILFGVLTFKPQIGIILPFALLAMREWRAIFAAAATFAALVGASILIMGVSPWVQYMTVTSGWQLAALVSTRGLFSYMGVAPLTGLLVLGLSPGLALPLQIAVTAAAILISCQVIRRTEDRRTQIFVLCSAVPLVSPYLLNYDLCLLTIPLTLRLVTLPDGPAGRRLLYWGAWLMPTLGLCLALTPVRQFQTLAPLVLLCVFAIAVAHADKQLDTDDSAMEAKPEPR